MSEQNRKPAPGKTQTVSPEREAAIAQFWNKYIAIIHAKGMKEPFDRWFVIRARQLYEICGSDISVQAHHEDYTRPLDVSWLCVLHHADRHREINNERRNIA